eukprot:gene4809-4969_t
MWPSLTCDLRSPPNSLGLAKVSYHGRHANATAPTPQIDALAQGGVRLESYYVNYLCSPTRTSIMSGRYAYNIGQNAQVITDGNPSCMPKSVTPARRVFAMVHTIADRLSGADWATAAYGK